jgi:putative lipoic acid-binding regulatory protein
MAHTAFITYPCIWPFKIIGRNREQLQQAAAEIITHQSFNFSLANSSRKGKYHCLNLEVSVADSTERDSIFTALKNHPWITMVI